MGEWLLNFALRWVRLQGFQGKVTSDIPDWNPTKAKKSNARQDAKCPIVRNSQISFAVLVTNIGKNTSNAESSLQIDLGYSPSTEP